MYVKASHILESEQQISYLIHTNSWLLRQWVANDWEGYTDCRIGFPWQASGQSQARKRVDFVFIDYA